ncbi:MAG: hypothetical protein AAF889_04690 [Cyanobacteria bacterium P01_D01_bin.73]
MAESGFSEWAIAVVAPQLSGNGVAWVDFDLPGIFSPGTFARKVAAAHATAHRHGDGACGGSNQELVGEVGAKP